MSIEPGALVCVTGANGFVGSWLIKALLERGYRVRATVRDPQNTDKTAHLRAMDPAGRLEIVAGDLLREGSYDEAVEGCDAVVHCAAAVFFAASDPQRELVDPSVRGTLNVLGSVQRATTVKRVVHTSSIVAAYHWDTPHDYVLTEADWNTTSTLSTDPYGVAKVEAEKAAVAFVEGLPAEERFELVHLNPGMVWGPPMIKAHAKASPALVRDILSAANPGVPRMWFSVVDVRDVALAHVAALEHAEPPPRCLLVAEEAWMDEIAAMLQGELPDVRMSTRALPKVLVLLVSLFDRSLNTAQLRKLVGRPLRADASLSRQVYGMCYRPLAETLRDTAVPLIENGWARVKRR